MSATFATVLATGSVQAQVPPSFWGVGTPGPSSVIAETPASLACVYQLVRQPIPGWPACNPNDPHVTKNPSGGSRAIAIVDVAGDYPTALGDLEYFSNWFGLPTPAFSVVYVTRCPTDAPCIGTTTPAIITKKISVGHGHLVIQPYSICLPRGTACITTTPQNPVTDEGESPMDIEWAHAMAPQASIILVEAASQNSNDEFAAVQVASKLLVKEFGGGEVSMSWEAGPENSINARFDLSLQYPGVVYFAAAHDRPGPPLMYPASSPYVVSVGGTTLVRSATGDFQSEIVWQLTSGGPSQVYSRPLFQAGISPITRAAQMCTALNPCCPTPPCRGIPDIAAVSSAARDIGTPFQTAAWVYHSSGWFLQGGTSLAAPVAAGIVNSAGAFRSSSSAELSYIYKYNQPSIPARGFTDITSGTCGCPAGTQNNNCMDSQTVLNELLTGALPGRYPALAGWDFCSGLGSPLTLDFK